MIDVLADEVYGHSFAKQRRQPFFLGESDQGVEHTCHQAAASVRGRYHDLTNFANVRVGRVEYREVRHCFAG